MFYKIPTIIIYTFLILTLYSCEEKKSATQTAKADPVTASDPAADNTNPSPAKAEVVPIPESYFTTAQSGLNYRKTPNGDIIGKYPLNTYVTVIEHSGIFEEIVDGSDKLKGEWLKVRNKNETGYVFSAFLSEIAIQSEIDLYYASLSHRENNNQAVGAFINLSGSYPIRDDDPDPIIAKEIWGDDPVSIKSKQRARFLKEIKVSESDQVFIYNFSSDRLYTFTVSSLPLVAYINAYSQGDDNISLYDYEFGLDLGDGYDGDYNNFVYIGKENIFQTGKVKPIIWEKIADISMPVNYDTPDIPEGMVRYFQGASLEGSYKFTADSYDYYLQILTLTNKLRCHWLAVTRTQTKQRVYSEFSIESEGSYPTSPYIKGKEDQYQAQWTGAIFKGKPSVFYHLTDYSFGCPGIRFLDSTEPPLPLLCDNRH